VLLIDAGEDGRDSGVECAEGGYRDSVKAKGILINSMITFSSESKTIRDFIAANPYGISDSLATIEPGGPKIRSCR
jgi:hypothetical protein